LTIEQEVVEAVTESAATVRERDWKARRSGSWREALVTASKVVVGNFMES
jgi:hypothetical protein